MGDILDFLKRVDFTDIAVNRLGINEQGQATINDQVVDVSSTCMDVPVFLIPQPQID